jgi:hypothetical protein
MKEFVEYEKTYLDHTMYRIPLINIPAVWEIRIRCAFIPFNAEKTLSFYDCCRNCNCKNKSLDLKKRIKFDQLAIERELVKYEREASERLNRSQIVDVSEFIIRDFDLLMD